VTSWDNLVEPGAVMRAAICGDWHGNQFFAARAIRYAKEHHADVILHVGDFAYRFAPKFMAHVQRTLEDTGLTLGFVPGNHDDYTYLDCKQAEYGATAIPLRPNIFYLPRNYRWEWNSVPFLAMGGAVSVDKKWRQPGREWWPRETIDQDEARQAIDEGPVGVMICHDVPDGVRIPCIEGNPFGFPADVLAEADQHRRLLRQIVDGVKPMYLFAGHYHCRLTDVLHGDGFETVVNILDGDGGDLENNVTFLDI